MGKDSTRATKIQEAEIVRDSRTFAEEVQHDQTQLEAILRRPEDFKKIHGENLSSEKQAELKLEEQTAGVLKRTLLAAETTGIQITDGEGNTVDASKNGLPLATYLMHGQRIKFEIPAGSGNEFANFIMNGDATLSGHPKEGPNVAKTIDSDKAHDQGKAVFTRVVATHGSKPNQDGTVTETKGPKEGLKDMGCHFGMNFGSGPYSSVDIHGREKGLDGLSGHVYIYYKAPTATEPGCMMVGMEGCVPPTIKQSLTGKSPEGQFDTHDLKGGADDFTTLGGRPAGSKTSKGEKIPGQLDGRLELEKEVYKDNNQEHPYKGTVIPRRYDGTAAKVTPEVMAELKKSQDIPNDIGNNLPKPKGTPSEMSMGEFGKEDTLDTATLNAGVKEKEDAKSAAKETEKQAKEANKKPSIGDRVKQFFTETLPAALFKGSEKGKNTEQKPIEIGAPTNPQRVGGVGDTRKDIQELLQQANQPEVGEGYAGPDRRGQSLADQVARKEAEVEKQKGGDPKEAAKSAKERMHEVFSKLRGKVSHKEASNASLPNVADKSREIDGR